MTDDPRMPDLPPDADPGALLAFMQRMMLALQQGEDPMDLLAEAPAGFQELFQSVQEQMASGELGDLGELKLGEMGTIAEDAEETGEPPADEEPNRRSGG